MKYLKTFEKRGNNGKKFLLSTLQTYEKVCDLIRDFINIESLVTEGEIKNVVYYYYESSVEKVGDRVLFVVFGDYEEKILDVPSIMISNEDEKKLHEFIENPELYQSTKKYNL